MAETEIESPEAAQLAEARRQAAPDRDPDEMKAAILDEARKADIINAGLTESRPEADEDDRDFSDPAVQQQLVAEGKRMLSESGYASKTDLPDEARDLYEESVVRELEDGTGTESGLAYALRDKDGFLALLKLSHDDEISELLDEYEADSPEDLANSSAFMDLDPDDQELVLQEIASSPSAEYARAVMDELAAEELPHRQAALAESTREAQAAEEQLWGEAVDRGMSSKRLNDERFGHAFTELTEMQHKLQQEGPAALAEMIDGFDPASPKHVALWDELARPLFERSAANPTDRQVLTGATQILSELYRRSASRYNGELARDPILRAAGTQPLVDHERQDLEEFNASQPSKKLITMGEIRQILDNPPPPNRTGRELNRDLQRQATRHRDEIDRAFRKNEKAHMTEMERRRRGIFGG